MGYEPAIGTAKRPLCQSSQACNTTAASLDACEFSYAASMHELL